MTPTDTWYSDDDTDCGYYDTPSGNIWCPDDEATKRARPQTWPAAGAAGPVREHSVRGGGGRPPAGPQPPVPRQPAPAAARAVLAGLPPGSGL